MKHTYLYLDGIEKKKFEHYGSMAVYLRSRRGLDVLLFFHRRGFIYL